MSQPERWTAETEEILAKAILLVAYQSEGEDTSGIDGDWAATDEENRTWVLAAIRPVLSALADAGLLLPPGAVVRQEWRVSGPGHKFHGLDLDPWERIYEERELADEHIDWLSRAHPQAAASLHQRTVTTHTGPWSEVQP